MSTEPYDPRAFYDAEAESYDERRSRGVVDRYCNERQLELVGSLIRPGGRVLEVAPGTGRVTPLLLESYDEVLGWDVSAEMLARLKDKLSGRPFSNRLTVSVGDARNTDLGAGEMDAVVCVNAVSHIPDTGSLLKEMARVLRVGGRMVFNVPNWLSVYLPFGLYVNYRRQSVRRGVYTRWFAPFQLRRMLHAAGLELVSMRGQVHVPWRAGSALLPAVRAADRLVSSGVGARFATNVMVAAEKAH